MRELCVYEGARGAMGRGKRRERGLSSLFPLPGISRALPFLPLPRPTAKQHERGHCGGERHLRPNCPCEDLIESLFLPKDFSSAKRKS